MWAGLNTILQNKFAVAVLDHPNSFSPSLCKVPDLLVSRLFYRLKGVIKPMDVFLTSPKQCFLVWQWLVDYNWVLLHIREGTFGPDHSTLGYSVWGGHHILE